jgi:hypothetical protein
MKKKGMAAWLMSGNMAIIIFAVFPQPVSAAMGVFFSFLPVILRHFIAFLSSCQIFHPFTEAGL